MKKWPGAPFLGSLHTAGAQNKTLISNTANDISHIRICWTRGLSLDLGYSILQWFLSR